MTQSGNSVVKQHSERSLEGKIVYLPLLSYYEPNHKKDDILSVYSSTAFLFIHRVYSYNIFLLNFSIKYITFQSMKAELDINISFNNMQQLILKFQLWQPTFTAVKLHCRFRNNILIDTFLSLVELSHIAWFT